MWPNKTKIKIIIAKNAGTCFGVKKAISKALEAIEKNPNVATLGEIVHNPQLVKLLSEKGLKTCNSIDEVKEKNLLIRSHGATKDTYQKAKEKSIELIDATCPLVKKPQDIVRIAFEKGKKIIIIGDENHPEIISVRSFSENQAIVISDDSEFDSKVNFNKDDKILIVAQTTLKREVFDRVLEIAKNKFSNIEAINTICDATKHRQNECAVISKNVELMIIVGGKNSSNTKKLYEIASQFTKAIFIEDAKNLDFNDLCTLDILDTNSNDRKNSCAKIIGVTAGASTPDFVIEEVLKRLQQLINDEFGNEMYSLQKGIN